MFGSYHGIHYTEFSLTGRRSGTMQLPMSRVQLRDADDHWRVISHVYNSIVVDAGAGALSGVALPGEAPDVEYDGASGEEHDPDAAPIADDECDGL